MVHRIKVWLVRFEFFRILYNGKIIARAATTISLESGRPALPEKVKRLEIFSESLTVCTNGVNSDIPRYHVFNPRWIYKIKDAILDSSRGDVYLDYKNRIYESSNWHPFSPEYSRTYVPKGDLSRITSEDVCYLAGWTYFHFLIENLPAYLAASQQSNLKQCLVFEDGPAYVFDALRALAVEPIAVGKYVEVNDLIFCGKGPDTGWMHPKDLDLLRSYYETYLSKSKSLQIVYVSRINSSRSPGNEFELEIRLRELNVKIVYAERLNFTEQIEVFSAATVLIGVHGAGLSNQIWMNPNSRVIEIIDLDYFNICFEGLAAVCGHSYSSILYQSSKDDGQIPIEKIMTIVQAEMSSH